MNKDPHRYDDMLCLPHHQSSTRPHMSLSDRAAQFSPFAALTGYDDMIRETARITDDRIVLDENSRAALDEKLHILQDHLSEHPTVSFIYFIPDTLKDGGSYITTTGIVKKIDLFRRTVILFAEPGISAEIEIKIDDIIHMSGELFTLN